jgi:hypothetical protein
VDINAQGPIIQFESLEYNYGTIAQGANGDCEFVFTNTGTTPVTLSNVRASCGCTTPSWPKEPVAPGAKGVIKVHYDTNRPGAFNKTITVTSTGSETPIVLKISGKVEAAATNQANVNQPAAGK